MTGGVGLEHVDAPEVANHAPAVHRTAFGQVLATGVLQSAVPARDAVRDADSDFAEVHGQELPRIGTARILHDTFAPGQALVFSNEK